MTDPKRWIDDGAPDDVRDLLVAAATEQPGKRNAERAIAALGASGALAGARAARAAPAAKGSAVALAGKGAIATGQSALAIKWGVLGVVAALATAGTAHVVLNRQQSPQRQQAPQQQGTRTSVVSASAPLATATSRSGEQQPAAASEAAAVPAIEPAASAPVARGAVTKATTEHGRAGVLAEPSPADAPPSSAPRESPEARESAPALAGEVAAIDAARDALRRGDPASVIATLNAYASRFANRHFEPEALYLRMEALGRQGDTDGQRSAATRLLAEFPSAPQAARARAVLDAP